MNALALTDHGNLHGSLQFYQVAKKLGINPVIGLRGLHRPGQPVQPKEAASMKEASLPPDLLAQNRTGSRTC